MLRSLTSATSGLQSFQQRMDVTNVQRMSNYQVPG